MAVEREPEGRSHSDYQRIFSALKLVCTSYACAALI